MAIFVLELFLFLFFVMGKEGGKRKREGEEGKRKSKRGEKEKEEKGKEQKKEEEVDDVIEEKKMEEKGREERNFQCGICLELMCWEKKPKILPSCLHSFCSVCLNKLFQSQSSSNTSSPSSSSSSSSSSLSPQSNGVVSCPVCRKVNQCDGVETLEMNYLIPETIDSLVSSKVISLSQQSSENQNEMECGNFEMCQNRTQMYCWTCKMFICDTCDPSHTSNFATRNHIREKQQQTQQSGEGLELERMKMKQCSIHPSERISGFCFECSILVCFRCVLENHVEHSKKVNSVEEVIEKRRDEVLNIGVKLENRLKEIEEVEKRIEEEMKELEKKLERKRSEKKEFELEKNDLKMRKDSIVRLSNTNPTNISLFFDQQLFSTLLQTASEIVREAIKSGSRSGLPKKGNICRDGVEFISSFPLVERPWGGSMNSEGTLFVATECSSLKVRDKEGGVIESVEEAIDLLQLEPVDVAIGLNDQIVLLDWAQQRYRVVILDKEGELIRSFGSAGSQPGQFDEPWGLSVDKEGRIIVADSGTHRIQIFNHEGCFIRSFDLADSWHTQSSEPFTVAVDPDGHLVISNDGNFPLQVMDIEGRLIRTAGSSQLRVPYHVDVDGKGRIVVTSRELDGNDPMCVFDNDGTFLFSFGEGRVERPHGVVVDSFGSIFVMCEEEIQVWG